MTALAGIKKEGENATKQTYNVHSVERVHENKEPSGIFSMEKAIVSSSNCYFIYLMNRLNLYKELSLLYRMVGVQCDFKDECKKYTPIVPYSLFYDKNEKIYRKWNSLFDATAVSALNSVY